MNTFVIRLGSLILLGASCLPAAAYELAGAVRVSGRQVEVRLWHKDDGRPAAGVNVRLLLGRQLAAASARTDERGLWVHSVSQTGAYEAVVETEPDGESRIKLPFTVLDTAERDSFPWVVGAMGVLFLVAGGVASAAMIANARKKGVGILLRQVLPAIALATPGVGLLVWCAWQKPAVASSPPDPDVASAARDFLRSRNVQPLSGPLELLLSDKSAKRIMTQLHPLLDQPAPDFQLSDDHEKSWRLHECIGRGPVVLVFYYGYHCNHCVGQLFALHDDMQKFRELGAEVLAVSADPPELTRQRFKQYGEFAFPVLSDSGNGVAQAYGVFRPASGKLRDDLQHGTFVIGRDGLVTWANVGNEPFTGNISLLYQLALLEGRLPAGVRD